MSTRHTEARRAFATEAVDLTVVIPAFNEAGRIGATLEKVSAWLQRDGRSFEVLVVDDGSVDQTSEVATSLGSPRIRVLLHHKNRGKGAAVRTGVAAAQGKAVLICDADLSTPIEELSRLEPHLATSPVVIGSRAELSAEILRPQSRMRVTLGRLFNWVVRWTTLSGVSDTQCGFKLLEGNTARRLFRRVSTDGFAFDVELLWLARRAGCSIAEVGVVWRHEQASTVRPWRDGISMLLEIFRFRLLHAAGASGHEPSYADRSHGPCVVDDTL